LRADWLERFAHPLVLLETFVDPQRFAGTIYRAANWQAELNHPSSRKTETSRNPDASETIARNA
ncbi:MAG: hypothetical protein ACR2RB_05900, partial [Gammaproteobacteria bacterium]